MVQVLCLPLSSIPANLAMRAGTLVNAKTIRFEPTAVISEQDIKDVISRMDEALADTKKALNV